MTVWHTNKLLPGSWNVCEEVMATTISKETDRSDNGYCFINNEVMEVCHCLPIFAHVLALSIQYVGVHHVQ